MITRRSFSGGLLAALVGCGAGKAARADELAADLAAIEAESGGRLGVAVLDTASGARSGHRAGERFAMCSTFKLLAAGAVLARADAGDERLDRRVRFEAGDLVPYSPITKDRVGGAGMTLAELCEAALTVSDNTAGNLLLAALGGPAELTAYARSLGDDVTRLDRIEPELNEARPGDPRDTTSPAAMLSNLHALVLGDALSAGSKDRLTQWLLDNKTGGARLRAGLPATWRVGDKTGSGDNGTANDVGVIWPGRAPILVSAYLTGTPATSEARNETLAKVARAVASALKR